MSFWSRVKGRKNSRRDDCADTHSLHKSHSCNGLAGASASGRQTDAKMSLAHFLAENVTDNVSGALHSQGGGANSSPSEDSESLTSWSSLVKQRSRLSKSVKVSFVAVFLQDSSLQNIVADMDPHSACDSGSLEVRSKVGWIRHLLARLFIKKTGTVYR